MGIITPIMSLVSRLRAAFLRLHGRLLRVRQIVGAVAGTGFLRLAAEELGLQDANLAAGFGKFRGQSLVAGHGVGMHALPRTHLTPQFTDLATQSFQALLQPF